MTPDQKEAIAELRRHAAGCNARWALALDALLAELAGKGKG